MYYRDAAAAAVVYDITSIVCISDFHCLLITLRCYVSKANTVFARRSIHASCLIPVALTNLQGET